MNYKSHPMRTPNMEQPDIPAAFDPSHSSLIPIPDLEPSYMNQWANWSCIKINAATPYGEMVAEARKEFKPPRGPSKTLFNNVMASYHDGMDYQEESRGIKRNASTLSIPEMQHTRRVGKNRYSN